MRSEGSSSRAPTPAVQLLIDVVNSAEPQEDTDAWDSPESLRRWLRQHRLPGPSGRPTPDDLRRLIGLREGLRAVLGTHTDHAADPAAVAGLNTALADVSLQMRFGDDGGYELSARSPGVDDMIGRVLDAVRVTHEDASWERVKVCARHTCRWAFYDNSRNRSARWCSMAGCGNAVKMRRAYATRRKRART
jgi:predicted RNA-binding Zn ribbon-like protein